MDSDLMGIAHLLYVVYLCVFVRDRNSNTDVVEQELMRCRRVFYTNIAIVI